jgi:hypothetical protein
VSTGITLSEAIAALVGEKRAIGYKYHAEAQVLARFEAFSRREFPGLDTLTETSVTAWITAARRRDVKPATLQGLTAPVRELARWLGRRGVLAYLLPSAALPRPARYVPHIYTDAELAGLFAQTDRCHYCSAVPARHLVMPVLFRMIYACGLRCSEARLLRVDDVEIDIGVLQIRDAKKAAKTGRYPSPDRYANGSPTTTPRPPSGPSGGSGSSPATGRASRSPSATSTRTSAGSSGRPASPTAGAGTAPGCTIFAILLRSTTCGPGSPKGETSARCCRCCRPIWVIHPSPTPATTCT